MFAIDTNQMMMIESNRRCKNSATQVDSAPNCPRCSSSNTKFCYYNNYSLAQPRYFCKGCRRYWTNGGSLRNVPVGGGCRKSRRAKSSSARNYGKGCNTSNSGSSSSDSLIQENGSNNGSEIDLAAVFAKFLNQEPSQNEVSDQELVSVSVSVTNSLDTPESHDQIPECNNDLLEELLVSGDQSDQNQEMVNLVMENEEFGLQNFVGDEIVQDVLWSEAETNSFSGISWQLPNDHDHQVNLQQQDFDSFSVDDQVNVSGNFISDQNSWSSFDNSSWQLPSFESFSRPY